MGIERVAVVSYHSSPLAEPGAGDAGGMTVYVRGCARALARRGVATDIFTRADSEDVRSIVQLSPGVRVVAVDAGPRRPLGKDALVAHLGEFAAGVRAFCTAQRAKYDIVHSHYWQSGIAAEPVRTLSAAALVHSAHTLGRVKNNSLAPGEFPEPQHRLDGERAVIEAADVLVASTDDEFEQLACLYGAPHDRVKVLHPGVDHGVFNPGSQRPARARAGLDPDAALLLYAGRIQPLKGLGLAVRALAVLTRSLDRRVQLVIAGGPSGAAGGREVQRLRDLARALGVDGSILWLGPRAHAQLAVYYRSADVVVSCSHSESFGLAALEAHACGVPVVATAVGGLSYVVRDGESGWLVDERDPDLFAGRIARLLTDDELARSFRAAAVRRASQFSWEATADSLLDLYQCLAAERAPELCTC